MAQHDNLGRLVSLVDSEMRSICGWLDDPITRESGCADEFVPCMNRRAVDRIEVMLRRAGYASYDEFMDEVAARTSDRFVYFCTSLPAWSGSNTPFFTREANA